MIKLKFKLSMQLWTNIQLIKNKTNKTLLITSVGNR